jgi:hypothetical protein
MKTLKFGILLLSLALAAAFAIPAGAIAAEDVVPPSNGGANQYTETYPTGGGNRNALTEGDEIAPGKVIGDRNAEKLEERGEEGEEVAELAAETSPTTEYVVPVAPAPSSGGGGGDGGTGAVKQSAGRGSGSGGGAPAGDPADRQKSSPVDPVVNAGGDTDVEGSGALGEIVGQAFGTSESGMGALLPILMLAAIFWAFLFTARRQRRPAA